MNKSAKFITTTALMAAIICILGPISLPIGPVPVSLTNLAILLTIYLIGMKRGTIAFLVYLLIGLIGLPVFSGFSGGVEKLAGPTGGYIIGFLPMCLITGLVVDKYYKNKLLCILGMIVATAVLYLLGTGWLAYSTGMTFGKALGVGVIPFIPVDLIKIVLCAFIGPVLKARLGREAMTTAAQY